MAKTQIYLEPIPDWEDHERPLMPGSPSTPSHSLVVRIGYLLAGIFIALTGGLSSAIITANLPNIQGDLGLTPVEGIWLTTSYVMVNISANLLLFKMRQQFGIRRFAEIGIVAFVMATGLHLVARDFPSAIIARMISGFTAASLSSLGIYYTLQAFPKSKMGQGICIGLGLTQIVLPIAYIFSPALHNLGDWQVFYRFELGMALCAMAIVVTLKLPPGVRIKAFEPLDFLTFLLIAPAIAMVAAVLAQGKTQWWLEQPWMAYALIASLGLFITGLMIEHYRPNPLIQTRWLGMGESINFVVAAIGMRFLLAEQTYTIPTMLRALGMGSDQLVGLYAAVLFGIITGVIVGALTFQPKALLPQVIASVFLIVVACFLDYGLTNLERPHNLFLSQFLTGISAGLFLPPLLMVAVMKALARGGQYIVTFVVLFSLTQSLGGLLGSAFFGTYQLHREHVYSAEIVTNLNLADPQVAQRLQMQSSALASTNSDVGLRNAEGAALLAQTVTREANVRAWDDTIALNGLLAILFLAWRVGQWIFNRYAIKSPPTATAASAA